MYIHVTERVRSVLGTRQDESGSRDEVILWPFERRVVQVVVTLLDVTHPPCLELGCTNTPREEKKRRDRKTSRNIH